MKKIFLSGFLSLFFAALYAQTLSCCASATESFACLSNDAAFVAKHDDPQPFRYDEQKGEMITFAASDGKDAQAYSIKNENKTNKYLIVFHEWWGLNDYIKQISDKLFSDLGTVHVIAVDLYDGKIAANKKEAQIYMQELKDERAKAIMQGLKNKLGADAEIATIGWCMGGGMSMQASLLFAGEAKACVIYYGMPEADVEKLKNLQANVLFIQAVQDKWINDEVVKTFETNMKTADKKLEVMRYDADHAFANPSNPKHNAEAAKDAYEHVLKFLKKNFSM